MRIRTYYPSEQSKKAKEIMLENEDWNLSDIGNALGVGRERARQLLLAENISIRDYRNSKKKNDRICPSCGGIKYSESNICSKCYKEIHNLSFICEICGDTFTRYKSQVEREGCSAPRFCSRECQGAWLGKNYGFQGANIGKVYQESGHKSE